MCRVRREPSRPGWSTRGSPGPYNIGANHQRTLPDATSLHGAHAEVDAPMTHVVADDRWALQERQDEPADRIHIGVLELHPKLLAHLFEALNTQGAELTVCFDHRLEGCGSI